MGGPDPLDRCPLPRLSRGSLTRPAAIKLLSAEEATQKRARRRQLPPPDYILLSFFDGVGSAALVLNSLCSKTRKTWRAIAWEIDSDLVKLVQEHFPDVIHRGDVDADNAEDILQAMNEIDPSRKAHIIITGGPPCKDNSRIRVTVHLAKSVRKDRS